MEKMDTYDNNEIYNIVGKNIKKYRKLKGLKQSELAEMCNLSVGFISDLESNTFRTISLNTLSLIAKMLDVKVMYLLEDLDK